MTQKNLRYQDGKSDKFWTISLSGYSHTVTYGRFGTTGQTQTKDFATVDAALKSYEKLVAEKLKKGYLEDGGASSIVTPTIASSPKTQPPHLEQNVTAIQDIPANWRSLALAEIQAQLGQNKKQLCELAAIDAIPNEYFALLDVEVRKAIASQTNTAKNLLIKLANDEHELVRQAIAANHATPDESLKLLAQDSSETVRHTLAKNIYTPASTLELLAGEAFANIRKAVCQHPNATDELCELLSSDFSDSQKHSYQVCRFYARQKRAGVEPLTKWNNYIQVTDWKRQNIPIVDWHNLTVQKILAYDSSWKQTTIIQDSKTPSHILEELARHDVSGFYCPIPVVGNGFIRRGIIQEAVACNPNTPVSSLYELANTNNLIVCIALASNPALPENLIWKLFENKDFLYAFDQSGNKSKWEEYGVGYGPGYEVWLYDLHWELARNPRTPVELLDRLLEHKANYVREVAERRLRDRYTALANAPDTSLEQLRVLLNNRDNVVRSAAAKNPNILAEFLQTYLKSSKSLARFFCLLHSELPIISITKSSQSAKWTDRYAIAQNFSTPKDILEKLTQDEHSSVRAAAQVALGLEVVYAPAVESTAQEAMETSPTIETATVAKSMPIELNIEKSLDLDPEDWLWATWRSHTPKPRSEAKPFNLQNALKRLQRIEGAKRNSSGHFYLNWSKAEIATDISPEEANFWLTAMTCNMPDGRPDAHWDKKNLADLVALLANMNFEDLPDRKQTICNLLRIGRSSSPQIALPVNKLFPIVEIIVELYHLYQSTNKNLVEYISLVFSPDYIKQYTTYYGWNPSLSIEQIAETLKYDARSLVTKLISGFKLYIYPYLTDAEIQAMQEQLRPTLIFPVDDLEIYKLAAYLKLHEQVKEKVATWQPNPLTAYYVNTSLGHALTSSEAIEIIFGLGNAAEIESHVRRLNLTIAMPEHLRGWFANTEFNALDVACKSIQTDEQLRVFALAKAPEVAPYMLELWLSLKKPQLARKWLEDYPSYAVVGLIPVIADTWVDPVRVKLNELKKAAIAFLQSMKRKGYESLISAALERETPEIAAKVRSLILEQDELNYEPFNSSTTPQWLSTGITELPKQKRAKPPTWVSYADLPPIVIGDRILNPEQINACLTALSLSTLDSPLELVKNLKTHANRQVLDTFIWALFERWLNEGAPSKEKWAMCALGLLGSDAIALKLTPLIRIWPGESQHPRAVLGLECLRAIGTDTALMQIHGIAQKIKFQGLKARAQDCIKAIARDRQLTTDQLADRIIPDCGLDAKGQRTFDFGSRQFKFLLGADLKPMLRDPQGKKIATLPKPNSKDDSELANSAIAD